MAVVPSVVYHRFGETTSRIGSLPAARFLVSSRVKPICFSSSASLGLTLYAGLRARGPHLSRCPSTSTSSSSCSSSSHDVPDERQEEQEERKASFAQTWERGKQGQGQGENNKLEDEDEDEQREWARREEEFQSILRVPREERDKAQRMQVIDRAAAALAAVNAFLADFPTTGSSQEKQFPPPPGRFACAAASSTPADPPRSHSTEKWIPASHVEVEPQGLPLPQEASADAGVDSFSSGRPGFQGSPGPDFWSWVPPAAKRERGLQPLHSAKASETKPSPQVLEKDETLVTLSIPFETAGPAEETIGIFQKRAMPSLPPLQSFMEVEKEKPAEPDAQPDMKMPWADTGDQLRAASIEESSTRGVNPDGSRWWQRAGVEHRVDGVMCNWTVIRGVSADEATEWEEKFWEASDAFEYKELGAEKSGRDLSGKVWREYWKETMGQDAGSGILYMERSADKWGKNAVGGEWREKWFEHYDASGNTKKWADKWSRIDPNTSLEAGHAHTWRERWGESFDGQGSAMKYTDKWAERKEHGDSWMKWGDKWDEHFDRQGSGVKQGETWWEGMDGEKWNRTWGEGHNGTGWIHKYGKSSCGEHWDTHVQEDTWYERMPHFGFHECHENSGKLRSVKPRKKEQS